MQYDALAYLTDDFIRRDCGIHGARFSDEDCIRIREEATRLYTCGKFHHTGVYWIANRLVGEGKIHPILP
ncbi:hypothetical protein NIES37_45000 [Tolypothrix tenuis PCC 7101]|uniref:Uncharacterized protein n=1 Tax=Tolypothrix tenuis PCC 7101 TaxID=231146 RepID=A0A1Z4N457_9CYAN|nr:hypothetical protein [Aulosira sp. FACHB-113]BAZ00508.1 hypothetical protein NIES37_45000 [Tolypothrix tenuis PCC 7101]BAZ75570.1 hypothetical protein NIES50_41580 [Aulosira laxa NIES-50]